VGVEVSPTLIPSSSINTTTSTQKSTSCVIPSGKSVTLTVVNASTHAPIPSVPVHVHWQTGLCAPTAVSSDLGVYLTNSSGEIELSMPEGGYNLNVTYFGDYYPVFVESAANLVGVQVSVPGGAVTYQYLNVETSTHSG
jgi:hypothetical protein